MILAIESSCDESALSLFDPKCGLKGEWVHSQIATHQLYGGVVPDIASREHLSNFPFLLDQLHQTIKEKNYKVSRIAVTCGPGLPGCLALGVSLAKALGLLWRTPLIGVNHLRAHAFSPFIPLHEEDPARFSERFQSYLPHLGLLVSGGNTLLFKIGTDRIFSIIAQTVDDAAGEALDKGARLLGLPYPGGPQIEKKAKDGNPSSFHFPRAFPKRDILKFSFSGLKTSLRYLLEKMDDATLTPKLPDICASYQDAVISALRIKTEQVLQTENFLSLGLSGGVANNKSLRNQFSMLAEENQTPLFIAKPRHTVDNAAMVAFTAFVDTYQDNILLPYNEVGLNPSLTLLESFLQK